MSFFGLTSLTTFILSLIIGIFVILKNKRSILNVSWFLVSFFTSLWSLGLFGVVSFDNYKVALFFQYMLDFSAVFIPVFFFLFILVLLDLYNKINRVFFKLFLFFGCFLSLLSFTRFFKMGVSSKFGFKYWIDPGKIYFIFPLFFSILVILSIYIILKNYKRLNGIKRRQALYVLITALIGFGGGATNFFPQLINTYPFGSFFTMFYILGIGYAIARYRLMDIRLIISKSILYFILVGLVTLVFTSLTFITGQIFTGEGASRILVTIFISLIVVIGLDPLKRLLAKLTDKVFYKDKIDYQEVLKKLGLIIAREIELKKLFIDLSLSLEQSIKCKKVSFLYKNSTTGIFREINDDNILFPGNDELIIFLNKNKDIIITEELDRKVREYDIGPERDKMLALIGRLDKMKIGLIAPIISENNITAILCIDKKLSGDTFSSEDIDLISVLTPQIANALEKSKLYNEIQGFNINLQTKIEQATKELKQVNIDLETRNKYLTSLQKISSTITRTLDLSKAVQFLATSIRSEIGFIGGVINFIDENKNAIYIGAMSSDGVIQKSVSVLKDHPTKYFVSLDDSNNLAIKSIMTGKIQKTNMLYDVFTPAITRQESEYIQKTLSINSIVSVPIYSESKIIGSIDYFLGINLENIKSTDLEVMKSLADQTGLIIANIKLYGQLSAKNSELEQVNAHLQKLDQAKSEFLSIASHQLRTPLTGIKGYLSMMLEGDFGKFTSKQNDIIGDVFEASNRMTKLVNVFLNVSRIESGRLKLELQEVDLKDVIEKSVKDLESSAEKKGIELSFKDVRKKEYKNKIKIDPDKIKDVILNLVDNSIKYTNKGHVEIEVDSDDENSTIKIQDTGIGLDKDDMQKLFSKFSRGNDSAKINTDGSGLGLYIARKMVEIHSGKIWVESDGKGKGSTFYITIPNNLS